jgi:hypothetical protein
MPIPLERVDHLGDGTIDPATTQRNFNKLAQLVPGFGGKSVEIRYGRTNTGGFGGGVVLTQSVTHGLGTTPVAILGTADSVSYTGVLRPVVCSVDSYSATTVTFRCYLPDGSTPAIGTVINWTVIG